MVRLAFPRAVAVLAAALATGCLGGQTGQPTSANCGSTTIEAGAAWNGSTVQAAVHAFEGTYAGGLTWQVESRASLVGTPVELPDGVQLTITYAALKATRNQCSNQLSVPVSVTLSTSDSGLAEAGAGTLTLSPGGVSATLHFETQRVRLDATLDEAAMATAPRGGFDALDTSLPGASASFTEGT